jgi:tRNA dimethylallyltransferase
MLNNGFVREVKNIEAKYGDNCAQLQTTGYREVLNYLKINDSEEELETAINNATYKLARKQMTWFRRNSNIVWVTDYQTAEQKIIEYLKV